MNLLLFSLNSGLLSHLAAGGYENPSIHYILAGVFALLTCIAAYLLGSVNGAIIVSRLIFRDDVRRHGSGNAGTTNMLRTYGKTAALLTLLVDLLKTALAILFAGLFFGFNYVGGISTGDGFCYVAGLFAVIGHVYPVYYKFKGGKGVLATATMALILTPVPFLLLLLVFIGIVAASKYVSLGSVSVAVLYPVLVNAYFKVMFSSYDKQLPGLIALSTIVIAILIVWCHRENLRRISDRTERKISFKSKKKDGKEE